MRRGEIELGCRLGMNWGVHSLSRGPRLKSHFRAIEVDYGMGWNGPLGVQGDQDMDTGSLRVMGSLARS